MMDELLLVIGLAVVACLLIRLVCEKDGGKS